MKLFEKIKVRQEKEIRFLGVPILQYGNKELSGFKEKYLNLFPKRSFRKDFFEYIIANLDKKYENIIFYEHHIGEFVIFLQLFNLIVKKYKLNDYVLIIGSQKFADLINLFGLEINYKVIKVDYYRMFDMFKEREIYNYKKMKFILFQSDNYLDFRVRLANGEKINFYKYICECFHLDKKNVPSIKFCPNLVLENSVKENVNRCNLNLDKFIIINPFAQSVEPLSIDFWQALINCLVENGYDVYLNSSNPGRYKNVKCIYLRLDEVALLSTYAKAIISLRSGLDDLLILANRPMHVVFTPLNGIKEKNSKYTLTGYSLKNLPFGNSNIFEYKFQNDESVILKQILRNIDLEVFDAKCNVK